MSSEFLEVSVFCLFVCFLSLHSYSRAWGKGGGGGGGGVWRGGGFCFSAESDRN